MSNQIRRTSADLSNIAQVGTNIADKMAEQLAGKGSSEAGVVELINAHSHTAAETRAATDLGQNENSAISRIHKIAGAALARGSVFKTLGEHSRYMAENLTGLHELLSSKQYASNS